MPAPISYITLSLSQGGIYRLASGGATNVASSAPTPAQARVSVDFIRAVVVIALAVCAQEVEAGLEIPSNHSHNNHHNDNNNDNNRMEITDQEGGIHANKGSTELDLALDPRDVFVRTACVLLSGTYP